MKSLHVLFIVYLVLSAFSCTHEKESPKAYVTNGNTLKFAYIVFFDSSIRITPEIEEMVETRLAAFSQIINSETLGKLQIVCTPFYIDVRALGLTGLDYTEKTFFQWMDSLLERDDLNTDFDIIAFTPISDIPWANDAHSIGFYYKRRVCFSLEYYPYTRRDNVEAIALMIHKMFHGFGYNHQNINMPALKLLNWDLGLPVNVGLEAELRNREGYNAFFFNQHILRVLNSSGDDAQNGGCLDSRGLVSQSAPWRKGMTTDAYGPYCWDADHDGILDDRDDYFLSSPIQGEDADEDGIVDTLDLVPWNHIRVSGNIDAGKIHIIATQDKSRIEFTSDIVNIIEIKAIYLKQVPVHVKPDHFPGCFPRQNARTIQGNRIVLEKDIQQPPIVRIEVYYEFQNNVYYRPYYFYFPGTPVVQIISEREWYYFLRYGADIPKGIDFYEVNTYDEDYDGIPDNTRYVYFKIPTTYDWDGDGFPDVNDTLPTVYGKFQNQFVKGVKDSDSDGLADPGYLDFSPPQSSISPEQYFDELKRAIGKNPEFDRSPYLRGDRNTSGFPNRHFNAF